MRESKTQHTSPLSEKTARKPTEWSDDLPRVNRQRDSLPWGQQSKRTVYHGVKRVKRQPTTGSTEQRESLPRKLTARRKSQHTKEAVKAKAQHTNRKMHLQNPEGIERAFTEEQMRSHCKTLSTQRTEQPFLELCPQSYTPQNPCSHWEVGAGWSSSLPFWPGVGLGGVAKSSTIYNQRCEEFCLLFFKSLPMKISYGAQWISCARKGDNDKQPTGFFSLPFVYRQQKWTKPPTWFGFAFLNFLSKFNFHCHTWQGSIRKSLCHL